MAGTVGTSQRPVRAGAHDGALAVRNLALATLAFALCFSVWGLIAPLAKKFEEDLGLSSMALVGVGFLLGVAGLSFAVGVPFVAGWFRGLRAAEAQGSPVAGGEGGLPRLDSGDPLFAVDRELRIVTWNPAVERLTGVPAGQAVGRHCWEVLEGVDTDGRSVCHAGCSHAEGVWEGHPAESPELLVTTRRGRRRVSLSTVGVRHDGQPVIAHTMRELAAAPPEVTEGSAGGDENTLSPRQLEVLELLDEGHRAREIAKELGISETTVRNHVRAILTRLGCHSQLEAVAEARRRGIIGGGGS